MTLLSGRYRLGDRLGEGGMGAVHIAFDERLRRDVAVKVVRSAFAEDATAIARFVREARAAAALSHPGIVTVFDTGVDEGTAFLVMERLTGESLADRLRRGRLDPAQAVRIASRVLEALAVAHAAGIVHRDVKPGNVFLCAPDGAPKLLDFGIASVRPAADDPKLTETGQGMGTPTYVAPEQLRGDAPDARADLYAVAAVLYEALAGRPPIEGKTIPEVYAKKLTEPAPKLRSIAPDVPEALAEVVDRSLLADPSARLRSATEMQAALLAAVGQEAIGLAETVGAVQPSSPAIPDPAATPRELPKPRRRGAVLAMAGGSAVVLVGGFAMLAAGGDRGGGHPRPAAATATAPAKTAQPQIAEPVVGLRALRDFHDARGSARTLLSSPSGWDAAAVDFVRAAEAPGAPARWRAGAKFAIGRAKLLRGDGEGARAAFEEAIRIDEALAAAHVGLSEARTITGDEAGALDAAARARAIEPDWWVPVAATAGVHSTAGRMEDAIAEYRRALTIAPDEPALFAGLALALHAARLDAEAERFAARAIEADPDSAIARLVLAERALERGDGATALAEATRAASVSPHSAAIHLARGDALAATGDVGEAMLAYREAVDLADRTRAIGLPAERLALVRAALESGRPPPPRTRANGRTRPHERTRPSGGGGHDDPLGGLDF